MYGNNGIIGIIDIIDIISISGIIVREKTNSPTIQSIGSPRRFGTGNMCGNVHFCARG